MTLKSEVGGRLRQLRGDSTMEEMARLVGVEVRQGWANWESGNHMIPVNRALKLGVSLDWLYGRRPAE